MACPVPKQHRSNYIHLDTVEPETWACIAALFQNINIGGTTGNLPVQLGDSASIDAFARLRVSNPSTLWDSQLQYDLHRVHWEDDITDTSGNAAVTHDADASEAQLYVEAGDTIVRQTRRYFRYQPGKSQMILVTFVMDNPNAYLTQRVGYFDSENGIFFENDAENYRIVRRSNVTGLAVDTRVEKADWNIDPLDGTGPSGYTMDATKAQIFFVDLEWLGVGRVRTGFVIDGIPYYTHEFLHANSVSNVYMTTANLPIRYEVAGTAELGVGKTFQAICSSVISEGGHDIAHGLQFGVSNEITTRSVSDSAYLPLIAIRPKLTFNSIVNRGRIIVENMSVYAAAQPIHYDVIWGGTVTGGSWTSAGADSITEYNVGGTSVSGGIEVSSGYIAASRQSEGQTDTNNTAEYPLFLDIAGAHPTTPYTDQWIVAAKALNTSTDCGATIDFREVR